MNIRLQVFSRICRQHLMNLFLIVPLLLAALFAYQAGNMFEFTAGSSRINATAKQATSTLSQPSTNAKVFLPENTLHVSYLYALARICSHSVKLPALRTSIPQRLRDLLLTPIKFTSHFVG